MHHRYALHPQSLLRTGILRHRGRLKSAARPARACMAGDVRGAVGASPPNQFEAIISARVSRSIGLEGMVNIPPITDKSARACTSQPASGPNVMATRSNETAGEIAARSMVRSVLPSAWTVGSTLQTYLIWEHSSEDDDRERSTKQLCNNDYPGPSEVGSL